MRFWLALLAFPLLAQNYAAYNNQPVARMSFLRHQFITGTNELGDPSLLGFWPINEGIGTIAFDHSGNKNNGIWSGPANGTYSGYYSSGKTSSWAGQFTSGSTGPTEAFLTCGTNVSTFKMGTGSYSMAGWVYGVAGGNPAVFGVGSSGTTARFSLAYSGPSNAVINTPNALIVDDASHSIGYGGTANQMPNSAWTFLAESVDRSLNQMNVYINGSLASGMPLSISTVTGNVSPQGNCTVGAIVNGNTPTLGGLINNVRFYNRALSQAEIQAIYNAENH